MFNKERKYGKGQHFGGRGGSFKSKGAGGSSDKPANGGERKSFGGPRKSFGGGGHHKSGGGFGGPRFRDQSKRFGGNQRFGGRGGKNGGPRKSQITDFTLFVRKAKPAEIEAAYVPQHRFVDFAIADSLKKNISSKGYLHPTPIQDQSIPSALAGSDVVGLANTGTGKTAAFLIPLINKVLLAKQNHKHEKVIIIAPTRELAVQINEELIGFVRGMNIQSVVCIGGASINNQIKKLKQDYHFLIGTPGRIKDLNNQQALNLSKFNNLVLDEVDRMLDMGFIRDITHIVEKLSTPRQSLFFSATMEKEIEQLIGRFMTNPIKVSTRVSAVKDTIEQDIVEFTTNSNKLDKLHDILKSDAVEKTVIFVQTKRGADRLGKELTARGFNVGSIHGDKTQAKRQKALDAFRNGHSSVLVATDVAARGLDISGITHVINFDLPNTYDDYTHRIGRTARAGKTGVAYTFVQKSEGVKPDQESN